MAREIADNDWQVQNIDTEKCGFGLYFLHLHAEGGIADEDPNLRTPL
jgi:hypothetical protein